MKALIVEDTETKRVALVEFLCEEFPDIKPDVAESFHGGLKKLAADKNDFAFVLLDMTMPNFDIGLEDKEGGTPESFAGRDLLSQMKFRSIIVPVIVITQFSKFGKDGDISIEQLKDELSMEFSPVYVGTVYYNVVTNEWKDELHRYIVDLLDSVS